MRVGWLSDQGPGLAKVHEETGVRELPGVMEAPQSWAGNWILVLILPGVGCEIPGWSLSLESQIFILTSGCELDR